MSAGVTGEGLARVVLAALALFASGGCRATAGSAEHAVHTGYAPVNGIQIWYEDHDGAGSDATPLVLLHGGGSTIETSFAAILPGLARTRRVIAFEQQGHGTPPTPIVRSPSRSRRRTRSRCCDG